MTTFTAPTLVRYGSVVRHTRANATGVSLDNASKARESAETGNDSTLSIGAVGESVSTNIDNE
jgi:hypothetical protein